MAEQRHLYEIKARSESEADVLIYEQIGEDFWGDGISAKRLVQDLATLDVERINLRINSPGGNAFDGQAIYNALVRHPATVTTYIDGVAASIASVIALAGERVVMAENALFMIHDPWGIAVGNVEDMMKMADLLDKCADTLVTVYARKSPRDRAELRDAMRDETWFSAAEAAEWGFVDEVEEPVQAAALSRFDLKSLGFRNVPAALLGRAEDTDTAPRSREEQGAEYAEERPAAARRVSWAAERHRILRRKEA